MFIERTLFHNFWHGHCSIISRPNRKQTHGFLKRETRKVTMAKDVITVDGEDRVVREDTAKSYRGVIWALTSIAAFIIIVAILVFGGFLKTATDGTPTKSPAEVEKQRQQ